MNHRSIKVFLADDNVDFCNIVSQYFETQEDIELIGTAHDGLSAFEQIKTLQPDIAILDGAMPHLDGLGVIEKLNQEATRPICIMLSSIRHESVTKYAYTLGVEYYIIKPFEISALAQRIRMFSKGKFPEEEGGYAPQQLAKPPIHPEKRISDVLHHLGIPTHIRGYHYIRIATMIVLENPEALHHITKELYPEVAKRCNTTAITVERSIRHAIHLAWSQKKKDNTAYLAQNNFNYSRNKPTNSEFISFVAEKIHLETIS